MGAFHLPVGGERFRPCLEDFIQMMSYDLEITMLDGWKNVLTDSRAEWRLTQLRTAVRDRQDIAAEELRRLNWKVEEPAGFSVNSRSKLTHGW